MAPTVLVGAIFASCDMMVRDHAPEEGTKRLEHDSTGLNHARRPSSCLSMISAQTAFVARENRFPLFRIML
jgi:hypothetical protein